MDKNVIRLNKITKVIGIICSVVFLIPMVILIFAGDALISLFFLPFVLLGVILFCAYKKQTIIIEEEELIFNYLVKKTQHVRYGNIHCLLMIPLNNKIQMALIDRQYNRLVSLDAMLSDMDMLFTKLEENDIPILDFGEMVENNQDVSQYINSLNVLERNYYKSVDSENQTIENLLKDDGINIERSKKILKIFGWILIFVDVAAFFIGSKEMTIIFVAVPLIVYSIYIKYYPYIYFESLTKKGQNKSLQLPFLGLMIALLIDISFAKVFNFEFGDWMIMTLCGTVILIIPFIVKSVRTDIPQRTGRKISVIIAVFFLSFVIAFPVNLILTFEKPRHETTTITDKKVSSGEKDKDYYLYGEWNGREEQFTVTKREYGETSVGDKKRICMRKSILGFEYHTIHR